MIYDKALQMAAQELGMPLSFHVGEFAESLERVPRVNWSTFNQLRMRWQEQASLLINFDDLICEV